MLLVTSLGTCPQFLSLRWNIVTEAISLITDRRTMFAMTIYTTLVMRTTKMAKRHKALAMSYCFSGFAKNFFFGGDPARSCEGRTAPSKPPLPWPTLLQLNLKCTLIFENIISHCHPRENLPLASRHCETCRKYGVAISLITDRRTMFAMTIYTTLVMTKKQNHHTAQMPLAMTTFFYTCHKFFVIASRAEYTARQSPCLDTKPNKRGFSNLRSLFCCYKKLMLVDS